MAVLSELRTNQNLVSASNPLPVTTVTPTGGNYVILSATTSAVQGVETLVGEVLTPSHPMDIQLDITVGKTATVELYGRLRSDCGWVKFETVALTDAGFLRSYDGVPTVAWKVTAIDAAAIAQICVMFDD